MSRINARRLLLTLSLLLSLSLSASAALHQQPASGCQRLSEESSLGFATVTLDADALTTSHSLQSGSPAAKQNRTKQPTPQMAVFTGRFGALASVNSSRSLAYEPGQSVSSAGFSRPRGRAPPLSA
jgi:hypothetical protein